ncbi:transcriptional regulator containing an amidase domain and an AraC-type DNA-binding HTH domain [Rhizobium sp. CF122]|uniref:GlxA family transcriptional regulator n=1 Tax=Rhizobium sp. CF122 TaxID=1144312 RepID=UPI000271A9D3|nr:GlxA family transcriptional regulator [Rhizobium sp. CF122]EJL49163.1 transcriptional regulator containing an amidase domain and an AraC-type DNA-binding HTH domain [Rhizobium sp. CF122]
MSQTDAPAEIGILLYPNVQLAAVYGLTDLFYLANRFAAVRQPSGGPALRVSHWRGTETAATIERVFDTVPGTPGSPTVLVLPPSFSEPMTSEEAGPLARWLRERHAEGTTLSSVCVGAFLLAETGLLAHRMATTHWVYADLLAQRFPEVRVDTDKLIIDEGDMITAGGMMAWTDLGLNLVERLLGSTIMLDTARHLLVDPPGREQRCYSSFSPRLNHGDGQILKVQHWLHASGARGVTLAAMAQRARLEERTFLRRFHKATGLRPTEYCQHLRVGKAREMLEFSNCTVEQIAAAAGYEDSGAFRKVFQKITGLSPGDYRNRFGLTGRV